MIWLVIILLLLSILLCLLLVPITMVIDTINNTYYLELKGLAKASVIEDNIEVLKIKMRILFFKSYMYPLKRMAIKKSKKTKVLKPKKERFINSKNLKRVLRVIKSFNIKKFYLNLDTGDYTANAKLYPVFSFLNFYKATNCNVNFVGENNVQLIIQNRPVRIIKSFINL
ncbi:hypothetical protein SAMN05444148_2624 [Winogradskyella jejuensis]|uniref:DUF2953 domain-containing protein n=2 Tax=Winogradskyella jejuensis TaxID=1089305 RepID=A0A1M5UW53_9FLAO|nr:hypothetical protein SAMN05444148_2624 [Winogradskyella jejuensis]